MRQTNLHTMDWFVSMKSLHIGIDKRLHQHIYSNKVANRGTLCAMPITPFIIIFICYYKLRKKTWLHYNLAFWSQMLSNKQVGITCWNLESSEFLVNITTHYNILMQDGA